MLISPTSHVKPMELLETFRLKSVFSKTERVARKLSSKEIGAAWDLPPDRIGKMETELILGRLSKSALVQSPSLKILQEDIGYLYPPSKATTLRTLKEVPLGDFLSDTSSCLHSSLKLRFRR